MEGYVRIYNGIVNHWIWKDPVTMKMWIDILLLSNHKNEIVTLFGRSYECKRGQFIISLQELANRHNTSKTITRRFLEKLRNENFIIIESLHASTMITVCNLENYVKNDL